MNLFFASTTKINYFFFTNTHFINNDDNLEKKLITFFYADLMVPKIGVLYMVISGLNDDVWGRIYNHSFSLTLILDLTEKTTVA